MITKALKLPKVALEHYPPRLASSDSPPSLEDSLSSPAKGTTFRISRRVIKTTIILERDVIRHWRSIN